MQLSVTMIGMVLMWLKLGRHHEFDSTAVSTAVLVALQVLLYGPVFLKFCCHVQVHLGSWLLNSRTTTTSWYGSGPYGTWGSWPLPEFRMMLIGFRIVLRLCVTAW
jgi:hypothetical protein